MAYPAFTVEFAPGVAASAVPTAPDWVDITDRVDARWSAQWGRWGEFTESGAGTASLTIANDDGEFDPDNSSGSHYGDLVAGLWFRIKGGTSSANTDVFYGHVSDEGFRVSASQFADSYVTVYLVDDLEQLANTDQPESEWAAQAESLAPLSWWRLGESRGTVMSDASGNGHHGTYLDGDTFNSRAGLVDGSDDPAIAFLNTDGAVVSMRDHPTAAITAFPFSVAFWYTAEATPASPLTAGPILWAQINDGDGATTAGGRMLIQHGGSAASVIGATNDGFLFLFTDASGNERKWTSQNALADGTTHLVVVTVTDPDNVVLFVDGVSSGITPYGSTGSTPAVAGERGSQIIGRGFSVTATLDEVMVFDSVIDSTEAALLYAAGHDPHAGELSGARAGRILDLVGYDATNRNIDSGRSTLQQSVPAGGDAASALKAVAKAEAGFLYVDHQDGGKVRFVDRQERWTAAASIASQCTFGDSGSEVTYDAIALTDDKVFNRATIQRANGAAVTVSDSVSEAARRRSFSDTGLLFETDTEAEYRAERIVAEKKDRHRVPTSITLRPRATTHSAWAHVFARKVNDMVTVKWRPPYGGTQTFTCWIDGISHKWDSGSGLTTTFSLSPVPFDATAAPYWCWGTSTWETGTPARWSY